eukprot:GGOE01002598.1.p1 GENE.GGOE01002598.1~~GGOE01002598.1.p1  ORF type:complete len:579 (+),score=176.32 GGOE01002598.1:53-1789(+)
MKKGKERNVSHSPGRGDSSAVARPAEQLDGASDEDQPSDGRSPDSTNRRRMFANSREKLAVLAAKGPNPKKVGANMGRMFTTMFTQVKKAGPGILLNATEKERVRCIRQKQREVRALYNARLQARQEDYGTLCTLTVTTATWNVAEHTPAELTNDLAQLFHADALPDIIAVSLQEVDMSPLAMTAGVTDKTRAWEALITSQLFHCMPTVRYIRLAADALVGLMLLVFVQEVHTGHVTHKVLSKSTAGSVLGVVGNKGGIACRFSLYGKRFLFVGCHLPAHAEAVEKRNEAYNAMLADFRFKLVANADDLLDRGYSTGTCKVDVSSTIPLARWERHQICTVPDHDYLFWIGDLNYRVTITNEEARDLITRGEFVTLLESDQLMASRRQREAFVGFEEGSVMFPPTYKLDPGTDRYDTSPKCRTPSWTDRILYACREDDPDMWAHIRAGLKVAALAADPLAVSKGVARSDSDPSASGAQSPPGGQSPHGDAALDGEEETEQGTDVREMDELQGRVDLLSYESHQQYRLSDHRPVTAVFEVTAIRIDQAKFDGLVEGIKVLVEPMEQHIDSMIKELYRQHD